MMMPYFCPVCESAPCRCPNGTINAIGFAMKQAAMGAEKRLSPEREQEIRAFLSMDAVVARLRHKTISRTGSPRQWASQDSEDVDRVLAELDAVRADLVQTRSERDMARAFNDQWQAEARAERADRIAAQERENDQHTLLLATRTECRDLERDVSTANERVRALEHWLRRTLDALLKEPGEGVTKIDAGKIRALLAQDEAREAGQ